MLHPLLAINGNRKACYRKSQSTFFRFWKSLVFFVVLSFSFPIMIQAKTVTTKSIAVHEECCLMQFLNAVEFCDEKSFIKDTCIHDHRGKELELVSTALGDRSSFEKNYLENQSNLVVDETYSSEVSSNHVNRFLKYGLLLIVIPVFLIINLRLYPLVNKGIKRIKQNQLRKQLDRHKFVIYYQPIIHPLSHQVMACEALLRYKDGKRVLTPFHFLNQMEELDMMEEVTLWLLKQVIKDYELIKQSQLNLDDDFYISLNLSFKELESSSFVDALKQILMGLDLRIIKLCFEIIESHPLKDERKVSEIIEELRTLGVKIAIDDFGVEHANLDILDKIEYDVIKLDKYFSDGLYHSFIRKEAILFIKDFVNDYQKKLIIEGIEEPYQLEFIKEFNHDFIYIQGYIYSPPVSLDEIIHLKIGE